MADRVSVQGKWKNSAISRHVCVDLCILFFQYLSTHMHFITNGCKHFSKTNSTDPRQRVPLKCAILFKGLQLEVEDLWKFERQVTHEATSDFKMAPYNNELRNMIIRPYAYYFKNVLPHIWNTLPLNLRYCL